ncbi:MAG: hypothetical protein ACJ8OJ_09210 [Povalibacter sp.]
MARCAYCSTFIMFGGNKDGDLRFCNADCQQRGVLKRVADQLPSDQVNAYVEDVHSGLCPKCAGPGPVDVHTSYRVWSALVMTQWTSRPAVCCRQCGLKSKLGSAVYSAVLGWWGFPWGVLVTPIQIVRNIAGLFVTPDPARPSSKLDNLLRLHLAAQAVAPKVPSAPR